MSLQRLSGTITTTVYSFMPVTVVGLDAKFTEEVKITDRLWLGNDGNIGPLVVTLVYDDHRLAARPEKPQMMTMSGAAIFKELEEVVDGSIARRRLTV